MRLCPWHTWPFDPGGRVAGEQFAPHRRLKFAMASMGKLDTTVSELGQEFGISRQTLRARLTERRSMPGRRTSALAKVETDSALERLRTKDVRRATSPFDAPVPVNAAGGERLARIVWRNGSGSSAAIMLSAMKRP